MLGLVVFGSRTWMCTTAAPALAASIEDCAICSGVTGTAGFLPGESAEPVTAHEIMTLRCMLPPRGGLEPPSGHCRGGHGGCRVPARASSSGRKQPENPSQVNDPGRLATH